METRVLVVCCVVGLLGLLSAATGFAAEGTRVKADQVFYVTLTTCAYPRSPAVGLGVTAALSLLAAKLTVSISSGCICCRQGPRPSGSKWVTAVISFVISWIMFVIAFVLLLVGAALNNQHDGKSVNSNDGNCYVVRPGLFAGATVLSIVSLMLGMCYFLILNPAKNQNTMGANIAMGQPQFPPPQANIPMRQP